MLKLAQALQTAGASVDAISLRGDGGSGTANGDVSESASSTTTWPTSTKWPASTVGHASHAGGLLRRSGLVPAHRRRQAGRPVRRRTSRFRPISRQERTPPAKPNPPAGRRGGAAPHHPVAARRAPACRGPGPAASRRLRRPTKGRAAYPHAESRLPATASLRSAATGAECRPASRAPTAIVVGADDELFNADQFEPMLQVVNTRIGLTVVPGKTHST